MPPIVPLASPDLCYSGGEVIGQLPGDQNLARTPSATSSGLRSIIASL